MALLHSCLVAKVRRPGPGEPAYVTLAESTGGSGEGTASAPVLAAHRELLGNSPEAVEARQRFSACVLIVDNAMRANHEFPDLVAAAVRRADAEATREAKEALRQSESEAADLQRKLEEARARQERAAAKLLALTGAAVKQVPVVAKADDAVADVAEDDAPAEDLELSADSEPEVSSAVDGDPVAKVAARLEAGDSVSEEDLMALTVPQLKVLAGRYDLPVPSSATKAELVKLILSDEGG